MNLILISGAEATCKSDLGKRLSRELQYVYQSKDTIKEAMFDRQERSTWNYGWYESEAKQVFFRDIERLINSNTNAVIESNFIGEDKRRLKKLIADGVNLKEIHCCADGLTSFRRAVQRNESGRRHPGHHDRRWYPKILFQSLLHAVGINIGAHKPVNVQGDVLILDTTHYPDIDFGSVIKFAQ